MRLTIYESVTNTIIAALKKGVVPWRKPWQSISAVPVNAISNRPYRGVNVLLLGMSPYSDNRWLTFKQVQERGGTVKQGMKSTMVVFWRATNKRQESKFRFCATSTCSTLSSARTTDFPRFMNQRRSMTTRGSKGPKCLRGPCHHHPR